MATPEKKPVSPTAFDTRVLQRNIGDGTLTPEDAQKFIDGLPDVAAKAEPFNTRLHGGEREEDDDDLDEGEG